MRHIGSDTFTLVYDAESRLVEVKKNDTPYANFAYDGDGKRVKSVVDGETILFVGAHYEVKNPQSLGEVTKYYFAGASRIAMRKYTIPVSMSVEYMLGDHLGSTSMTTDATGVKISEMRYKAWGETRYTWTDAPANPSPAYAMTRYQYTGQFSYEAEFGLYFYNARWYDSQLGRFAQADTIVPSPGNSQAWDRFAYTLNNPLKYTDPSGHVPCSDIYEFCGTMVFDGQITTSILRRALRRYDVHLTTDGESQWRFANVHAVYFAITIIANKFSEETGNSPTQSFKDVFGSMEIRMCKSGCVDSGFGWAKGDHLILFDGFYGSMEKNIRLVTHEFGHIFDRAVCGSRGSSGACPNIFAGLGARGDLSRSWGFCSVFSSACLGRTGYEDQGFAGGWEDWQFGANLADGTGSSGEVWADMFLGWTFDSWDSTNLGNYRSTYMAFNMTYYLTYLFNK